MTVESDRRGVSVVEVLRALATIYDPCSLRTGTPLSIVDMGLVRDVQVTNDCDVELTLTVTSPGCTLYPVFARAAEHAVAALSGVRSVSIAVRADLLWSPSFMSARARKQRLLRENLDLRISPRQWQSSAPPGKS